MEVDLWCIDLDRAVAPESVAGVLSPAERQRSESFRLPRLKQRFIAARLAMRTLLGRYLSMPAHALRFATTPYGKPYLPNAPDVHFNLSHSDHLAVIGIGVGASRIGVDIERVTPEFDWAPIADLSFSEAERTCLQKMPERRRNVSFFEIWTRKEAYAKGRGLGLSLDPRSFCTVGNGSALPVPVATAPETSDGRIWYLFEASPEQGYTGTLACMAPTVTIRHLRYNPGDARPTIQYLRSG